MARVTVKSLEELQAFVGKEIGESETHTVTQEQIQSFADATHDQQWIHTDPKRAAAESPFGDTIAHGYLTMSMAPFFLSQILEVEGLKMGVNYGIEKLRFIEPVKVGAVMKARAELMELKNLRGTAKCTFKITFEMEGVKKPAAVAEVVYLYQFT